MELMLEEYEKLESNGTLLKSLKDVHQTIDVLVRARSAIDLSQFPRIV